MRHEVEHPAYVVGVLEVERDRALAAAEDVLLGRYDGQGRPAGTVDAHDVGTEVGQQHAGERRRSDAGQLDDPQAGERTRHRCSLGSTSRPKTSIHSAWLRPTLCR